MNKQGFTLVEVLVAIVIIGIAFVSLLATNNSCTTTNGYGVELSTSEFLIEQIRELTRLLPVSDPDGGITFGPEESALANYDDLDDFDGFDSSNLSGPINSERVSMSDFSAFSQQVTVERVSASNFQTVIPDNDSNPKAFVRVTVTTFLNSKEISSASWIRATY